MGEGQKSSEWKNSFVLKEMKKEVTGSALNDIGNAFIWSGFKYYLRQPNDSYVVFSPVKYWKAQHLINKEFMGGFAFNRKHFHTNIDACIMVALWSNKDSDITSLSIRGYDIDTESNTLVDYGYLPVVRINSLYSKVYYDKRSFSDDKVKCILIGLDGLEKIGGKHRNKPLSNSNIIGYLIANTSGFDQPDLNSGLLVSGRYDGNGFYLRRDNYLEKHPMFAAARYITYNRQWSERSRVMKSADVATKFFKDVNNGKLYSFLLKCLLFTCLETQNHMRTFEGSDGHFYKNELCLDGSNGETIATNDLMNLQLNETDKTLIKQWDLVLKKAKETVSYNPNLTYGVYQIIKELDTFWKDDTTNKTHYDNIELHTSLQTLKTLVKDYYNKEIVPTLFEYEFLK